VVKDSRLFFKLALGFSDNHKIRPLSDAAFRCLVEAIDWCRSQPNDGWLPSRYAVARWGLDVLQELATNDPEKPSLIAVETGVTGWQIHDYGAMNDTKADIQARSERNKRNGQRGGLAKSKQVASESLSEKLAVVEVVVEKEVTTNVVTSSDASPKTAKRNKPRTRINPAYMPTQAIVDAIKAETGATSDQLKFQHSQFVDYWQGRGEPMADWHATWRRWMRQAHSRGDFGATPAPNGKTHKLRALADLAAEVREMETVNGKALEA
jgi:hypothetical protein